MNPQTASSLTASEREVRLGDLATFGSGLVTQIVPHYVELMLELADLVPAVDAERDEARVIDQLRTTGLTFGLPLIHAVRLISECGAELSADDAGDDPRAMLPLLRPLAESYLSLAGITRLSDVAEAFAASPESIDALLDDPGLNRWLLLQRRKGRLDGGTSPQ